MKKILIIIALFIIGYFLSIDEYNNIDNTIRFRVIANSNSTEDILMKELVVKELSSILFKDVNNKEEMNKNIFDNLNNIENKINKIFKDNNYNKKYYINYGKNEFPKKVFMGKTYKEGIYDSLVIEIGNAKGNNYFCILYPSLCMIDYENRNEKIEFKSKLLEYLNSIF